MATLAEKEYLARQDILRAARAKLRDYPQVNELVDGEEHDEKTLSRCLDLILDEINSTPPPVGVWFAHNSPLHILVTGVVSEALESAALLYYRNDMQFSAGGASVQLTQPQTYHQMALQLRQRFEQQLIRHKVALNHQTAVDATGGVHSEYLLVNRPAQNLSSYVFSGQASY